MKVIRAISIGVLSALLASVLLRFLPLPLPVLALSVAIISAVAVVVGGISPAVAAAGGALTGIIVAVTLAFTLNAAPIEPGAHRPGLRDLWGKPLVLLLVGVCACAFAGWLSARIAILLLARRR
jgi:hypothetical protein